LIEKEAIIDIGVTTLSFDVLIENVCEYIVSEKGQKIIVCANPHSIIMAKKDEEFFNALNNADVCLPDGTGVLLASKIMGGKIKKRIAGPDFFMKFTEYASGNGIALRYFFLGSTETNLLKIKGKMEDMFPHVSVSGAYAPPMGDWADDENEKITNLIDNSGANVLWVGLGAPKQEKWINQNSGKLKVSVIAAIGAAFDFFAGTKRRSPRFFRNIGLEWLPRFFLEPRRLWRRNLVSMPRFIALVLGEFILKKRGRDK
jgi:N-acetylglucosaminyldiphosphoundecaprenol N-acetyl-beta-D-mannosaminyltransferase